MSTEKDKPCEPEKIVPESLAVVMTELGFDTPVAELVTKRGVYTSEQFKRTNPVKWEWIVQLRACTWSVNRISRELHVAWETVRAVVESPEGGAELREVSKRVKGLCDRITLAGLEAIYERMMRGEAVSAFDLKMIHEIGQTSVGLPTVVTGEYKGPDPDKLNQLIEKMLSETGLAGENPGQFGGVREVEGVVRDVLPPGLPGVSLSDIPKMPNHERVVDSHPDERSESGGCNDV
jgi:hypothetical protein